MRRASSLSYVGHIADFHFARRRRWPPANELLNGARLIWQSIDAVMTRGHDGRFRVAHDDHGTDAAIAADGPAALASTTMMIGRGAARRMEAGMSAIPRRHFWAIIVWRSARATEYFDIDAAA